MRRLVQWFVLSLVICPLALFAQGTTTSVSGTVTSGGVPLPGATVTIASPALQGTRTAVSAEGGGYRFAALPPGLYTITFELSGMQPVVKRVTLSLAQASRVDADLVVSAVSEAITITAAAPAVLETTEVTTNFDATAIEELPVGRTMDDAVLLAPGVNDAGPNDQIIISGAQSFDNLFLVNGVVVNENLRGQPKKYYVEDAIQETTILTGGVSAEYGRFTGGVVSAITKSGGNEFSGSLRDSLTNDSWTSKTDFASQVDPVDELNEVYEGTFGGRIIRDRLWFFAAGRSEERATQRQTSITNVPFTDGREETRWEGKLTGQITAKHNIVGSYLDYEQDREGVTFGTVVDLRSVTTRSDIGSLTSVKYNGILTENLLLEAQWSAMEDGFKQGANDRDLINGTLLRDTSTGRRMWSPAFCGDPCPLKERNNESQLLKASYFLPTASVGDHNIVGGYEDFHQTRNENNFQSGSDYRIHGHFFYDGPNVYFGIDPSRSAEIEWDPVPNLSKTSDFAVRSFFLNDKWDLSNRWNFNAGVRYDSAYGEDQAGNKTVDDANFSPRLAAQFDLRGDGQHKFSATYGRYVAKVEQGPADVSATAGRYASYYYDYEGPVINPVGTPIDQLIPVPQVIQMVFDWFFANGGTSRTPNSSFIPGVTTQFRDKLEAPYMDEITLGYGMAIGNRGYVRGDLINRVWDKFYVVYRDLSTGKDIDPNGRSVDIGYVENSRGDLEREYNGVQLQGSYRWGSRWSFGGNYTYSTLEGNVEGETATGATSLSEETNRPEYTGFAQYNPVGNLDGDIRHRANLWLGYDVPMPWGSLNVSLLERFHSGLPYSAFATIDVRSNTATGPGADGVVNPGYSQPPASVGYFFSERGEYRLDDISSTDLALNFAYPAGPLEIFLQAELLNMFDQQGVEDPSFITQTIRTRRNGARFPSGNDAVAFNPFTTTPVEGVHYEKDVNWGKPSSADAYQLPRTYRFSVGLRF